MLEVSESIRIGRPPATVQAQFGDVGYHQRSGHHRGVQFTVLEDTAQSCRYEQLTKVGPIRVRQCFVLDRGDLGHQENTLVSGAFAPGAIEFVIEGDGDESTVVATLRTEPRGLTRVVQPLLRPILRRSLKAALREDRDDLESGRYERSPSASRSVSPRSHRERTRNPSGDTSQEAPSMTRTRSEYRLSPVTTEPPSIERVTRRVVGTDRDELAALMLDAFSGTIDDEGEGIDDALGAVDHYVTGMEQDHSFVVTEGDRVVAMAFVVVVDGVYYVDPIAVAADRKRSGLGRDAVRILLDSLVSEDVSCVGATITDGNIASERLFLGLGFTRRGSWG